VDAKERIRAKIEKLRKQLATFTSSSRSRSLSSNSVFHNERMAKVPKSNDEYFNAKLGVIISSQAVQSLFLLLSDIKRSLLFYFSTDLDVHPSFSSSTSTSIVNLNFFFAGFPPPFFSFIPFLNSLIVSSFLARTSASASILAFNPALMAFCESI